MAELDDHYADFEREERTSGSERPAAAVPVARRSRRGRDPLPQLLHHQHVVHTQGCLTSAPMGQI